jgi:hypothetical protein
MCTKIERWETAGLQRSEVRTFCKEKTIMERMATIVNGVDVNQLVGTIEAIKENPRLARCQFRAETEWINGGHSQTKIQGFYAAGQEDTSRTRPFIVDGDEPPVLLGENRGPNAVETVLHFDSASM